MDDLPLIEHDGRRFKLSSDYLTRVHRIADAFWVIVEVDEDGNELRMVEGWSSMIEPQSAWESAVEWLRKNGPEGVRWRS